MSPLVSGYDTPSNLDEPTRCEISMNDHSKAAPDGKRRFSMAEWKAKKRAEEQGGDANIAGVALNDEPHVVLESTPQSPTGSFFGRFSPSNNLEFAHVVLESTPQSPTGSFFGRVSPSNEIESMIYDTINSP